jgi:hypothetical protein
MDIIQSDNYVALGAQFSVEVVMILNEALKKHIISKELRKEICGDFTFNFSMLLDQGEINNSKPSLAFIENDSLLIKNDGFDYHDYAFGNVDEVFDAE